MPKERQAVVIIQDQDSELADTLHIRQSGKGEPEEPANLFPKTHPRLGYKANSATTVTFTILLPWEATVTYGDEATGWLSVSPTSGEAGEATLQLTSTMTNEASTERNAYIDITYGDKTQRLTVTQRAYGETEITDRFDPNFARVLQKQGYIPDANSITEKEVKRITELPYLYDEGLTSLRGIEYLTALTRLNCPNNQLTTLDVSKNTALTQLWCYNNKITTLDVSGCTALTLLWCQENQITTLDVSKNTALTRLYCNENQLSALDVSKNTELIDLYCSSNKITTLDVSKNTALTHLNCFGNQLSTLDISKNTALLNLHCGANQLSTLDISKNTTLATLYCGRNQLTTLDISKNTALACLSCHGNQLSTLDASKNLRLTTLECQENPGNGTTFLLKAWFDRNDMPEDMLTGWYYNDKHITIEFQKNDTEIFAKTDYSLDYKANSINVDFFVPNAWKASIVYEGNNSEWLSLSKMSGEAGRAILELTPTRNTKGTERKAYLDITYGDKRQRLTITQQAIKGNITDRFDPKFAQVLQEEGYIPDANTITEEEAKEITILILSNKELTTLRGIEYFTALTLLRCENNRLTTLDVSKNTELVELSCENNQLTTLDASGCSALTRLECHNNQLTTLNVSKNTALTYLKCNNNQLNTLDVSKNTALTYLGCNNNQLTTLDVSKNTTFIHLNCAYNQLSTLDVSKNTKLTELYCSSNKITTLDVSKCTALTHLSCYGNRLTTLDISKNTALTTLVCNDNQLSLLDISKNRALNELSCSNPGNGSALPVLTWFNEKNIPDPLYNPLSGSKYILCNTEETEYLLPFYANSTIFGFAFPCAWKASVSYEGDASGWLSISPTSGEAGQVIINLDATRNSKDPERKAYIDITYGNETRRITVTQNRLGENFAERFDPDFARVLQEKGYIQDATAFTEEDVRKINGIDVSSSKLTSLEGIKYFTALTSLKCNGNRLTTLDISKNTALTTLECNDNQLTALDVSQNTALTGLYCNNNRITTLDVNKNTKLQYLYCSSNKLTTLDVSKTRLLHVLDCSSNQLTTLDVNNTHMCELECFSNKLTSLDISKDLQLRRLSCYGNPGNGSTFPITAWFDENNIPSSLNNYMSKEWDYDGKHITIEIHTNQFPQTEFFHGSSSEATLITFCVPTDWQASITYEGNTSEWLSVTPTSGQAGVSKITARTYYNTTDYERKAYIDIAYNGKTQRLTLTQAGREGNLRDQFDTDFVKMLGYYYYILDTNYIKAEDVNKIKELDVRWDMASMKGIEYFTELTTLKISSGWVSSLDVSKNKKLTTLTGRIGELNVNGCTALTTLDCWGSSSLIELDVSGCPALTTLNCSNCGLIKFNMDGCTALTSLNCSNNQLTTLDVSKCSALTELHCGGNLFPTLDISQNAALTTLSCNKSRLSTLDVSGHTALTTLECNGEVQESSFGSLEYKSQLTTLNVSGCTALTTLSCKDNPLTTLNVSGCPALTKLDCSTNRLTALDVSRNTALTTLNCDGNPLGTLDVSQNAALTTLSCNNSRLSTLDVSGHTALTTLKCNGKNQQLSNGSWKYNGQLTTLNVSGCSALTSLSCYGNQLTSLDVSGCTALSSLSCTDNRITTLDVSGCTKLTYLYCYNNRLTTLDMSPNMALTGLYCYNNQITTLDVNRCTALTNLSCYKNRLTTLDISKNTALTTLECNDNQLSTLHMSNCTKLTDLNCTNNKLPSLDVSECIRLTKLQCHNNPGDKETSFPLKTWLPGEKPQKITIESSSWRWQEPFSSTQKTITITYQ